jgi:hypothetical protein
MVDTEFAMQTQMRTKIAKESTVRHRLRTSRHRGFHHHHHLFPDQHSRSIAELEVIAEHHREHAPASGATTTPGAGSGVSPAREQLSGSCEVLPKLRW